MTNKTKTASFQLTIVGSSLRPERLEEEWIQREKIDITANLFKLVKDEEMGKQVETRQQKEEEKSA